jgi:hypothetical protein
MRLQSRFGLTQGIHPFQQVPFRLVSEHIHSARPLQQQQQIPATPVKCARHSQKAVGIFCSNCKALLCSRDVSAHDSYRFINLESAVTQQDMQAAMTQAKQSMPAVRKAIETCVTLREDIGRSKQARVITIIKDARDKRIAHFTQSVTDTAQVMTDQVADTVVRSCMS